ncbi:helix-turn-helix domain-containing protein [Brachybacterium sp. EF45031]|uniref:sugar-binding transcriptional regulator n=1 Tax=Brachybacterium sillae TaxID=2810536 RepID=UPI00217D8EDF|nr:sugar-binding domain-containing protein [Brachybacterium sillae]MCS6711534.1 helix-turn-helix domain-containing protein [Brachybacterium sillae]
MPRSTRLETAFEAARMYYDAGQTMESIARELQVSRSTVSRLLATARGEGLVTISLRPPGLHRAAELRRELERRYGVRAVVVPARAGNSQRDRLTAVAREAARVTDDLLRPDITVGIAWGTTVSAVVEQLMPRPLPGVRIVQLNGAITTEGSGLDYVAGVLDRAGASWDASVHHFPVPAFFDYAATRTALWRERSVQRVLDLQRSCRLAVFGVGTFDAEVPSHAYSPGYLTARDVTELQEDGAVGDVCTVFLRADGSWAPVRLNARSSGPDPDRLARIPRRVLVAAGARKAVPLRAALRAGVATDLVVDEVTATRMATLD